jgi:hypothetical protein
LIVALFLSFTNILADYCVFIGIRPWEA